jgi:hypothetical protein
VDDRGNVRRMSATDPFGAMVAAAGDNAEAALALAGAYARVPRPARAALIDAVQAGAVSEGVSTVGPLAALLAVEVDPELAGRIRDALFSGAPQGGSAPVMPTAAAWTSGDTVDGAVVLARPLYGPFVDVVAVVWEGGRVVRTCVEPLLRHDAITRVSMALPDAASLEATDYHRARQRMIDVVWCHLRDGLGTLPASLAAHV